MDTTDLVNLLVELRRRGVQLRATQGHLEAVPKSALTDPLREALRMHKPALLQLLREETVGADADEAVADEAIIPSHPIVTSTAELSDPTNCEPPPWVWVDNEPVGNLGTPWLLPYRALVEAAYAQQLPAEPVALPHGITVDNVHRTVLSVVREVKRISVTSCGRALSVEEKAQLRVCTHILEQLQIRTTRLEPPA